MTFLDSEPNRFYVASYTDGGPLRTVTVPEYAQLVFACPSDLLVVVNRKLGSQQAGLYVNRGTRWLFALQYQDIGLAFGGDYNVCVHVNPTAVTSFSSQSIVYRNGYPAVIPSVLPGANVAWAVLTPKATVSQPSLAANATAKADTFEFVQSVASSVWTIDHPLGKFPSVTILDSSGDEIEGDVRYVSPTRVTVTFSAAFGGRAFLN